MTFCTEKINGIEIIYSSKKQEYKDFVLLISGGGTQIASIRFKELQEGLLQNDIGSISFNFQGIGNSDGKMNEDTLNKRIKTSVDILHFVKKYFVFKKLSIYGVSMGGYVALGVLEKEAINGVLIMHVPAAYATDAQNVSFDEKFTAILRRDCSWYDSISFEQIKNIANRTLLITHSADVIVPQEIFSKYENIISKKSFSKTVKIVGAPHTIWNNDATNRFFKEQVISEILHFLGSASDDESF